jgi:adenylosuccinate synthase
MINSIDWIALTKLDVLGGIRKIKMCLEYDIDGESVKIAPPNVRTLQKAKPIYMLLDGWSALTKEEWRRIAVKGWDALPENAKIYIEMLEELLGRPIKLVSVGASAGMEVAK